MDFGLGMEDVRDSQKALLEMVGDEKQKGMDGTNIREDLDKLHSKAKKKGKGTGTGSPARTTGRPLGTINGTGKNHAYEVADFKFIHESIIDALLRNPTLSNKQLGEIFDLSPTYISKLTCSNGFRARFMERKKELVDPIIVTDLEDSLQGLVQTSVDVLLEKLNKHESQVDGDLAEKVLRSSSRALGMGMAGNQGNQTQVNFVVAMPGKEEDPHDWAEKHKGLGAGTSVLIDDGDKGRN